MNFKDLFNKVTWVQNSYWNALLGVVLFLKQHPWESSRHTRFQCVENTAGKTLLLWSLSDTKSTGADFLHQGFTLAGLDSQRMCGRCFFFFYESWASSLLINRESIGFCYLEHGLDWALWKEQWNNDACNWKKHWWASIICADAEAPTLFGIMQPT